MALRVRVISLLETSFWPWNVTKREEVAGAQRDQQNMRPIDIFSAFGC